MYICPIPQPRPYSKDNLWKFHIPLILSFTNSIFWDPFLSLRISNDIPWAYITHIVMKDMNMFVLKERDSYVELWQNACSELEKLQEIERVCCVFYMYLQDCNAHSLLAPEKRGNLVFYQLQEKDGELKGRSRAMTGLQVNYSVVLPKIVIPTSIKMKIIICYLSFLLEWEPDNIS